MDIAQKEFKIDKKLKIIESNWAKQIFIFDTYKENYIFGALDDMMEILDANSLDLMGMKAQGKYVEYFIQTVESWREKLGRVDIVVNEWLKVQKNWRILVNIFVGSEDIRQQLPEDTKVFETVHGEFTEMMAAAHENPLIIETYTEGRKTALIEMSQKIKKCEKALNDYLEQKKKVFPRFYFLSNQSLLTILSNGQNPPKVCEFIGDCFDGLKTLILLDVDDHRQELVLQTTLRDDEVDDGTLVSNFRPEVRVGELGHEVELELRIVIDNLSSQLQRVATCLLYNGAG